MRRDRWEVATVENTIDIAAPAEELFDFVVDVRNEPRWNPQMLQVQMLTPEPVGAGTTFQVIFGRGVGEAVIEDTKIDRPHSWMAVGRSRVLDVESEGQILDVPGASRLIMRTRLRPRGTLRLLTPALGWWMHRTWEQEGTAGGTGRYRRTGPHRVIRRSPAAESTDAAANLAAHPPRPRHPSMDRRTPLRHR